MNNILEGQCQCGCGEITNVYRGKYRRFIKGHQARGENNSRFGIQLDNDIKQKISLSNKGKQVGENNPFFGKKHTPISRQKMSDKGRGIAKTPRRGINKNCIVCNNEFYISQSEIETTFYCSNECKNKDFSQRFSGENNPFYGKQHTEEAKNIIRQSSAKQRSLALILPTKPEKEIHNELNKLGVLFNTEYLINDKFCVDVFVPKYNLIIYIDGCYWHACPIHFPNAKKPNYDNARIPYLTKCGYNVEIIWEHDIKERLDEVIQNICLKYNIQILKVC